MTSHLVEIDLLRGGQPMPAERRPGCTYSVLVSRADRRPQADFWPFGLRDPLPTVPVPLRLGDGYAWLDLRAILDRVYDESGYDEFIYKHEPGPPLTGDDDAWARPFLPPQPTGTQSPSWNPKQTAGNLPSQPPSQRVPERRTGRYAGPCVDAGTDAMPHPVHHQLRLGLKRTVIVSQPVVQYPGAVDRAAPMQVATRVPELRDRSVSSEPCGIPTMLQWILCENEHARLPDAWELPRQADEVRPCVACGEAARLQPIPPEEQRRSSPATTSPDMRSCARSNGTRCRRIPGPPG